MLRSAELKLTNSHHVFDETFTKASAFCVSQAGNTLYNRKANHNSSLAMTKITGTLQLSAQNRSSHTGHSAGLIQYWNSQHVLCVGDPIHDMFRIHISNLLKNEG